MPPFLDLSGLSKGFGPVTVLEEVSLAVEAGEILVLLGPSGSGKTTLLRLIAGFERPDAGSILLAGEEIGGLPPNRRNFGMVFQHYALFPHLSVGDNVAFGLASRKVPRADARRRVGEVLPLVELGGFEERRVHELSGGQQQRVALARALAPDPRLLLLDEPLSNLDPTLRERTRRQLKRVLAGVGITAVWVTHEQEEAFDVGHRVALLNDGRLEQVGRPEELYLEPRNHFVAEFVGQASFLPGRYEGEGRVTIGDDRFQGQGVTWPGVPAVELAPGAPVELALRPESLSLAPAGAGEVLAGEIVERRYAGETTYYQLELELGVTARVVGRHDAGAPGERAAVKLHAEGPPGRIFPRTAPPEETP